MTGSLLDILKLRVGIATKKGTHRSAPPMDDTMINSRMNPMGEDFSEQLARLIAFPPAGSIPMTITPDMARVILDRNEANRPISSLTAQKYAAEMKRGEWRNTRTPIIFSASGALIDGQHRATGCIISDTPFDVHLAFGAPDEAFAYIDIGKKRTAADIFAINGVKHHVLIAAAMVWVDKYISGRMASQAGTGKGAADLYAMYEQHTAISQSVSFGAKFKKSAIASPSMMTALHYICSSKSRRDADAFFTVAGDGFGAENKFDPPLALRNKLIERNSNFERLHPTVSSGLTITAWNLARSGRSGRGLRFDPTSTCPRVR